MKYTRSLISFICFSLILIFGIACKNSPTETKADIAGKEEKTNGNKVMSLEPSEFARYMKKSGAVLIDLAFPPEFEQGHIEGAININFFDPNFQSTILKLDITKKYLLYCKNDTQMLAAGTFMKQSGFTEVYTLKGGWQAWKEYQKK